MTDDLDIPDFLRRTPEGDMAKIGAREQQLREMRKAEAAKPAPRNIKSPTASAPAQSKEKNVENLTSIAAAIEAPAEKTAPKPEPIGKARKAAKKAASVNIEDLHKSDHPAAKANAASWTERPGQVQKRKAAKAAGKPAGSPKRAKARKAKAPAKKPLGKPARAGAAASGDRSPLAIGTFMAAGGATGRSMDAICEKFDMDAHPMRTKIFIARHELGFQVEYDAKRKVYITKAPK